MIFDEIVLHNFGVYLGRQTLQLAPTDAKKPVILFGGMNGAGKTTLLDALQVGLYGKLARSSNRGTIAYEEFLRRSMHRSVDPSEGAAIEIQFRQSSEGEEHQFRVHRSWSANGKGMKEKLEIVRDGKLDRVLTDSWSEYVEELIPSRISHLFFFDGEKIEGFADIENSAELLSVAIHSLLGLDLVDRLSTDLLVLERRRRKDFRSDGDRVDIEAAEEEVRRLEDLKAEVVIQRGSVQNEVDLAEKLLREAETKFRQEGGELFEQRKEIEAERAAVEAQLRVAELELRELADGPTPLLMIEQLVAELLEQDLKEEESENGALFSKILADRDKKIVGKLKEIRLPAQAVSTMSKILEDDRKHRKADCGESYLRLNFETRTQLRALEVALSNVQAAIAKAVQVADEYSALLVDLDRKLAGIPSDDTIARVIASRDAAINLRDAAKIRLERLDSELERARRELEHKQAVLARYIEREVETEFEKEDSSRIVFHSQKVRVTLQKFRTSVVRRNVARIEQLVLDSFRQMLRKESLVGSLKIDPETFTVELRGTDHKLISPDRLSAGERQLLAVSLLWGLGRASGRPLPTVIDTPLGRLDSAHRTRLVERYFPYASHQVLLLSTDEEIDAKYYEKLRPWVGRSYRLEFDDKTNATSIQQGYFW